MKTIQKLAISISLCIIPLSALGVSGHITANTTWSTDQIVTGDLTIDVGVTLTIAAGVTVTFPFLDQNSDGIGDIDIIINGRLLTQGTPSQKVYFKPYATSGIRWGKEWGGIQYLTPAAGELSTLSNTVIEHAYQGLLINGRNMTLNGCTIQNCFTNGIYVQSTTYTTTLNSTEIQHCAGYGLRIEQGTLVINGLSIESISQYGMHVQNADVTITNATISNCTQHGFKAFTGAQVSANGLNVSYSGREGIYIEGTTSATFSNCRIVSNSHNGILINNDNPSFSNSLIANNGWNGVAIMGNGSAPDFTSCSIRENHCTGMIFTDGSTGQITYCDVLNNYGTGCSVIENSLPVINNCNIFGNCKDSVETKPFLWIGNSTILRTHIPLIAGLSQIHTLGYHIGGQAQLTDELNNVFFSTFPSGWTSLTSSGSSVIHVTCNASSRIIIDTLALLNNRTRIQFATSNSAGVVNAGYNYWGQIINVDDRVYFQNVGTVSYANIQTNQVPSAGCSLPNVAPTISMTEPSGFSIDPDSIILKWIDADEDNNAFIEFYYDNGTDTTGTLWATAYEDDLTDSLSLTLSTLADGTYHVYAKISDGVNPPSYSYAPGVFSKGPLRVYIPTDAYGIPGTSVEVPIIAQNTIEVHNIISFQFTLTYNTSILTATGINTSGTLIDNWMVFSNLSVPGQISVNGYSTLPLSTGGDLIKIQFDINPLAANLATSPLNFADFTFNAGNPAPPIIDGLFTAVKEYLISGHSYYYFNNNPIPGLKLSTQIDANTIDVYTDSAGDYTFPWLLSGTYTVFPEYDEDIPPLVVTPFDASMTARYALSLYSLTNDQQLAADVDGNNNPTVFDAALMAQYSVGLLTDFTAGKWIISPDSNTYTLTSNLTNSDYKLIAYGDPSGNWAAPPAKKNRIAIDPITAKERKEIRIPIRYGSPFSSYLLEVAYNSNHLTFIGLDKDPAVKDFQLVENNADGHLRIGAYDLDEISVTGDILTLVFLVNSSAPADLFITALFDEKEGMVVGLNEQEIPGSGIGIVYPNPSSSYAILPVSITESQQLSLKLFDVQGRLIKTIYDNTITVGNHEIRFNTSSLEDGVYFIQMNTRDGVVSSQRFVVFRAQ